MCTLYIKHDPRTNPTTQTYTFPLPSTQRSSMHGQMLKRSSYALPAGCLNINGEDYGGKLIGQRRMSAAQNRQSRKACCALLSHQLYINPTTPSHSHLLPSINTIQHRPLSKSTEYNAMSLCSWPCFLDLRTMILKNYLIQDQRLFLRMMIGENMVLCSALMCLISRKYVAS